MCSTYLQVEIVENMFHELRIPDPEKATIREILAVVNRLEKETGVRYIRMEMGVPGLKPARIGVEAEIKALESGVASVYPMVDGLEELKQESARFVKNFMNINVSPEACIPAVGSMQSTFAAFLAVANAGVSRDCALFIDPGFPVQKQQMMVLGLKYQTFDVYNFRGKKLKDKLESYFEKGDIHSVIYSNPNNPTWICLTEEELQIIGELARKYDVVVMEDLAYFGMDFRRDIHIPGQPPYQVSAAHFTDNYILFISSSKIFSYAGQRCAVMAISDKLFHREYPDLQRRFNCSTFGNTVVQRILYALSSGTSHSAQYALAAMFRAANNGEFNFIDDVKEYGEKAKVMKRLFRENGFYIVYDKDLEEPIADGFYFTIGYPGMSGGQLVKNLLYFGISAISLKNSGCEREGIRACVSHVRREQFGDMEERLKMFHEYYSRDVRPDLSASQLSKK